MGLEARDTLAPTVEVGGVTCTPVARAWTFTARRGRRGACGVVAGPHHLVVDGPGGRARLAVPHLERRIVVAVGAAVAAVDGARLARRARAAA